MSLNRFAPYLSFALALAACKAGSGSATKASASASAAPSASASAAPRRLKPMRRMGVTAYAFNASRELTLTDDQITELEKLEDQAVVGDPETRAANQQYQADISAGLQSGKFDTARLKADYEALDKAAATAQQNDAQALNGLHGALDAQQRTTVVANSRARQAAFEAHRPPDNPDAGAARHKEMLDRMTQDLALDGSQQKKVATLLAKDDGGIGVGSITNREETKKRLDALLDAFDKDDFDATKLDLEGSPHESQEKEATYLIRVVAILTPDQRAKFAAGRAHPMPMNPHGFQGGPGGMRPMFPPPSMPSGSPGSAPASPGTSAAPKQP